MNIKTMWKISQCALCLALATTHACWGQNNGWMTLEKCSVKVERIFDVPAQERGFITNLAVELNQPVQAGDLLAELDNETATHELNMAEIQLVIANEMAQDDAEVRYQETKLRKAQEDLESSRSIRNSVSESELRSLSLAVEQATLDLIRAKRGNGRAVNEAKLKEEMMKLARLRLQRRSIYAKCSGVVTAVKTQNGQAVEAGMTILEIQDLENLIIDRLVPIAEVNIAELVGAEVRVDVERNQETIRLSGQITPYDPRVNSGGLVRVHARVKNVQRGNDWVLLPGSEVTMHVQPRARPSGQAKAIINSPFYSR